MAGIETAINAGLTTDEINVLIEALKSWVVKDDSSALVGDMFGSLFTANDPIAKSEWETKSQQAAIERKAAKESREETAALLQAKLITMKRSRML
jgi:hypothetical protein